VLIGIASRNSPTALSNRSWYRPSAPASPVTYASLTLPPSLWATPCTAGNDVANVSKYRASERSRITSERAGSVLSTWRWMEPARRASSPARTGSSCGRVSARVASPSIRHARAALRAVASSTALLVACKGVAGPGSVSSGDAGGIADG
jgi:hypothetical protein